MDSGEITEKTVLFWESKTFVLLRSPDMDNEAECVLISPLCPTKGN